MGTRSEVVIPSMPPLEAVAAVLLDIEGTTTPISFVYEVLFPFARERLEEACAAARNDPRLAATVAGLRGEWESERAAGREVPPFGSGAAYARLLMDEDRKSTALKELQGIIWEEGYRSGALRGEVFPDVPPALRRWKNRGLRLRIFSSGSVLAQRLLFAHTAFGDLTPFFEGFHDTHTGPKRARGAYETIARAFGLPPQEVLFLSDVPEELQAAAEAGMRTVLVSRPGNRPVERPAHPVCHSFDELG